MLYDNILTPEEINMSTVFNEYDNLKNIIEKSLLKGELTYAIPAKVNEIESYQFPLRNISVRGTLLWNALYPDNSINVPDKVNFVKLSVPMEKGDYEYDKVCEFIDNDDEIDDDEKLRIKEIINDVIYKDEDFAHFGMNAICFPKKVNKLPKWLTSMISMDKMIEDNLKPGYKILKSLQSKVLSYQVGDDKGETLSNIVNI